MEEQAFPLVGEVGQRDLGLCVRNADDATAQGHIMLLAREDMLNQSAYFGLLAIGLGCPFRHRFASEFTLLDLVDAAMAALPGLVRL